jgi:replicative DNA helicase
MKKIPPQAIDLEKAVLGAIMIEKGAIETATELLRPEMFYTDGHQMIYRAFLDLESKSQPIDILTVIDYLKARNELEAAGGSYYITTLTNDVVSSAHLDKHCRKLVEKYVLRELIKIGGTLYAKGYDETSDPFELIELCEKSLLDINLNLKVKDFLHIGSTLIEVYGELEELRHRDYFLTGITTGFKELDKTLCGWQKSDFVILAARPKCGKTAMALSFGLNAAKAGNGVGFFSMEMSAPQLVKRLLANEAEMYLQSLRDARLTEEQMKHLFSNGVQKLGGLPFFIDDTAALSVADFKARARRMVRKEGVKLLIVDYLQLMQPDKNRKAGSREQEVSQIARSMKIAAKELNVPIIALSQLSREVEKRGNHVPQLSDLRESGSLEQDADIVAFLYKPSEDDIKADLSKEKQVFFKLAAYRNGEPKTIEFEFEGIHQRFTEKGTATVIQLPPNFKKLDNDGFPGSKNYNPTGTDDTAPF